MKTLGIGFIVVALSLSGCKTEEIILHGNLAGTVTDAESGMPVNEAKVILNIANDTAITEIDGSFLLKDLTPGQYEVQASKATYASGKQIADVESGVTKQVDFSLYGIPTPNPSVKFLDFGLDSTTLRFSISNIGKGKFNYFITPSKGWISVSSTSGVIENEPVIIIVTIMKNGLSGDIYKETLKVFTFVGQTPLPEITIPVYLNGVADRDGNYYRVVTIGKQIWMAENINVGTQITISQNSANNGIIEKYCYDNNPDYCKVYGGLYQWDEMMQYNPPENVVPGTTQGICPVNWHLPTPNEWTVLSQNPGLSAGKLKEAGFEHWAIPNLEANNESGFSALPGSKAGTATNYDGFINLQIREQGNWWSAGDQSPDFPCCSSGPSMVYNSDVKYYQVFDKSDGLSVRCLKN